MTKFLDEKELFDETRPSPRLVTSESATGSLETESTSTDHSDAKTDASAQTPHVRWLVWWIAGCTLVLVLAFCLGLFVRSPWEEAVANSQAHPVVTTRVETRQFAAEDVEVEGTVFLGSSLSVAPPGEGRAVVTEVHQKAGATIKAGEALIDVSGRPIIVLELPFALYRDIAPGATGPDVRAVQQSLKKIGVYDGSVDGKYGTNTSSAVRRLYTRAGVDPPTVSAELQAQVEETHEALRAAETAKGDKRDALAVAQARAAYEKAVVAAGVSLPAGEIVSITSDKAQVVSIQSVGARLDGEEAASAATLRTGSPHVVARVGMSNIDAFRQGGTVEVLSRSDMTTQIEGTVAQVSGFKETTGEADVPGYDVTITFAGNDKLSFQDESNVFVRVPLDNNAKTSGLSVPVIALREDKHGHFVLVHRDSEPRRIDVTVVRQSDGYALVEGDDLDKGMVVVVAGEA